MARYQRLAPEAFAGALERLRIWDNGRKNRSYQAAAEVLCQGWRVSSAASVFGVSPEAIRKAIIRIRAEVAAAHACPECGRPLEKR